LNFSKICGNIHSSRCIAGAVVAGGKFTAGVVDIGGSMTPVSLTLAANLPPVWLTTVENLQRWGVQMFFKSANFFLLNCNRKSANFLGEQPANCKSSDFSP
jgi:hypothetical protein